MEILLSVGGEAIRGDTFRLFHPFNHSSFTFHPSFHSFIHYLHPHSFILSLIRSFPSPFHPFTHTSLILFHYSFHLFIHSLSPGLKTLPIVPGINKWYIENPWILSQNRSCFMHSFPFHPSFFHSSFHPFNCNNPNWRVQNFKNESQTLVGSSFHPFIISSFHPFILSSFHPFILSSIVHPSVNHIIII